MKHKNQKRLMRNEKPRFKSFNGNKVGGWKYWMGREISRGRKLDITYIDLKGLDINETEKKLSKFIENQNKINDFPFRVITHGNPDKEIILRDILESMNLKQMIMSDGNVGCKTILR